MRNKLTIFLVIALLIGGITTTFAYSKIKAHQKQELELVPIIATASNIEAYSILSEENIRVEYISAKFVDEFTVTEKDQLLNKITTVPLYEGRAIDMRLITDKPDDIGNKQVVGVNIDAVRFAGVSDGDMIDIYWLGTNENPLPAQKIAHNAKVLRVSDEKGVPINESKNIARSAAASAGLAKMENPRIVYLLLDPQEVPYVVQGSASGNNKISFSKKPIEDIASDWEVPELEDDIDESDTTINIE